MPTVPLLRASQKIAVFPTVESAESYTNWTLALRLQTVVGLVTFGPNDLVSRRSPTYCPEPERMIFPARLVFFRPAEAAWILWTGMGET